MGDETREIAPGYGEEGSKEIDLMLGTALQTLRETARLALAGQSYPCQTDAVVRAYAVLTDFLTYGTVNVGIRVEG